MAILNKYKKHIKENHDPLKKEEEGKKKNANNQINIKR